jgi:hypothetical protein
MALRKVAAATLVDFEAQPEAAEGQEGMRWWLAGRPGVRSADADMRID